MENTIDLRTMRKVLRKGNFKGHIKTGNVDCEYIIYGVSKHMGYYKFNIKVSNYKVKEYAYGIGEYRWVPYKLSRAPHDVSIVRHLNWAIRSQVCLYWEKFISGTFGISHWRIDVGLIKRI